MSNCETKCQFRVGPRHNKCDALITLNLHPNPRRLGLPKDMKCKTPYLPGTVCPISIAMLDLGITLEKALNRQQGIIHYANQVIDAFKKESHEIPDPNYPHPSRVFETVVGDLIRMFKMSTEDAVSVATGLEKRARITHEKDSI